MKFDEEPNYAKLISLFDTLIEPCSALRAVRIDGALKVNQLSTILSACHIGSVKINISILINLYLK
jgi:hypothetical protein